MTTAEEAFRIVFTNMPSDERQKFYALVRNALYPNDALPYDTMIQELRDARFAEGISCPHCKSPRYKRNGKTRGRQRYLCHDCGKSYGDVSVSLLTKTRYPEKWLQYLECMAQGLSLRKTAKQLDIHVSTAFFWRHKVLLSLMREPIDGLSGIVEADEMYILDSLKGKNQVKKLGTRQPRKRGGASKYRGISREQVCILVATDRKSNAIAQMAGYGRISSLEIDEVIGNYLQGATCLCTDSATNFATYARTKGVEHYALNVRRGERVRGIYHIQHANAYHSRFRKWMAKFQGVATKYINHYLEWFRYIEQHKRLSMGSKRQDMLVRAFINSKHVLTNSLKPCYSA